jgi:hypothetical protein
VTYLNGEDPDIEREFYIGTTVSGLMDPSHAVANRPQPPRLARVQLGEMVERRIEEGVRVRVEKQRESTREGTHTRFRMQASEPEGERSVPRETPPLREAWRGLGLGREDLSSLSRYFNPFGGSPTGSSMLRRPIPEPEGVKPVSRELKQSCKTQSPSSPDKIPSPLQSRTHWMMENDPRTEEQADADWRRVTESLFGTNTRAEPKVAEWKDCEEKNFVPNWGNNLIPVSQELREEEKRWADLWKQRRLVEDRKTIDKQREGRGSPLRGNRKFKATFLDEIDDPHGDNVRAEASGYERAPQYPYTMEDVRRHDAEVNELMSNYTHPDRLVCFGTDVELH